MRNVARTERAERVRAALARVGLAGYEERHPRRMSGGQQQRVALARALVVAPETLLLDEPLSNLDASLREEMRFEIRRLHDQFRTTTVYVTHDQAEAMTTADQIAVMNGGRIEQLGTPEDIYERPISEFVAKFIGASNVLKGAAVDDRHVMIAGVALRTTGLTLQAGRLTPVAIRQHDIRLAAAGQGEPPANTLAGIVRRQVFLGASRDYVVELADKTEVRIAAPADQALATGTSVWLHLDPARCRALKA
jgi:iron(III) transport system ATP-binding protein